MKKYYKLRCFLWVISGMLIQYTSAQVPYTTPPQWRFGYQAGMNFPNGNAPVVVPGFTHSDLGQENSTTMCDTSGNVVFSSNSYRLFNGNNVFVQTLAGGNSSTAGCTAVPDPANPFDHFYLFTANVDPNGGGSGTNNGINYYHIRHDGGGNITVLSGPTQLATATETGESLVTSADDANGYWLISRERGGRRYFAWHITPSGIATTRTESTGTHSVPSETYITTLKVSKCQTRIGMVSANGALEVYQWNNATGQIGTLVHSSTSNLVRAYGMEFSPNGEMLYYAIGAPGSPTVAQVNLSSGNVTVLSTSPSNNIQEFGTMQLAPDGKIYVTSVAHAPAGSAVYLSVIADPDQNGIACLYEPQGFQLKAANASTFPYMYRGIVNQSWVNPTLAIKDTGSCRAKYFVYDFKTYYQRADIPVLALSEEWDFGEGDGWETGLGHEPSHTYTSGGTYTVRLRLTDNSCGKVWTQETSVQVNGCTPGNPGNPVEVCNTPITAAIASVDAIIELKNENPLTVSLDGTSSSFDTGSAHTPQYFWSVGAADTTNADAKEAQPDFIFSHNGVGSHLPEGNYEIFLVILQGVCMDTTSVSFQIQYNPDPVTPGCQHPVEARIVAPQEIMVDNNNPAVATLSGTTSIFDPAGTDQPRYYWALGSPDTSTSAVFATTATTSLTFAYNSKGGHLPQGHYDVYLIVQQGDYCMDTAKVELHITHFFIPNLVTPNGDQLNEKFEITNTPGRFDVEIYNRWGDRVYKEKGYTDNWDLSSVSDGVYYYQVDDNESGNTYKGWVQIIH
jgi:hypothetical protein